MKNGNWQSKAVVFVFIVVFVISFGCASQKALKHVEQGKQFQINNKFEDAENEFRLALELENTNEAQFNLGHILAMREKCEEAIELLDLANDLKDATQKEKDLAFCNMKLGKYIEAAEHYVKAIELDPVDEKLTISSAPLWKNLDKDQRILVWLERIKAAQPKMYHAYAFIGNHHFRLAETNKAMKSYDEALLINPKCLPVLLRYASLYIGQGQPAKAVDKLKAALIIEDDKDVRLSLAGALYMSAKFKAALVELDTLLKADPNSGDANALKAQVYYIQGDYENTITFGLKAIEVMPKNVALKKIIGDSAFKLERCDLVEKIYKDVLIVDKKNADAYEKFGVCYLKQGKKNAAKQMLLFALRFDPNKKLARKTLGIINYDDGQYDDSIKHFGEHLKLDNKDFKVRLYLALSLFNQGRAKYNEAEKALLYASEVDKNNPVPYSRLSVIYTTRSIFVKALDYLEKAAELGFTDTEFLNHPDFRTVKYGPRFIAVSKKVEANKAARSTPAIVVPQN